VRPATLLLPTRSTLRSRQLPVLLSSAVMSQHFSILLGHFKSCPPAWFLIVKVQLRWAEKDVASRTCCIAFSDAVLLVWFRSWGGIRRTCHQARQHCRAMSTKTERRHVLRRDGRGVPPPSDPHHRGLACDPFPTPRPATARGRAYTLKRDSLPNRLRRDESIEANNVRIIATGSSGTDQESRLYRICIKSIRTE
jgi:hypothetical protein